MRIHCSPSNGVRANLKIALQLPARFLHEFKLTWLYWTHNYAVLSREELSLSLSRLCKASWLFRNYYEEDFPNSRTTPGNFNDLIPFALHLKITPITPERLSEFSYIYISGWPTKDKTHLHINV